MKRWEERITVSAPPDKVFAYVSDFMRHGEWSAHGLQVSKVGDSPVAVGTKFSTVAKLFGTQREQSTITEITPVEKFSWDSVGALGRIHHWFAIREDAGSTTLLKGLEAVEPTLLAKLMMFKISKDAPKSLRSDLAKIKANVEGSVR